MARSRRSAGPVLIAGALLALAPAARGATYCVASPPGCPSANVTLTAALNAAGASAEDDTIEIGATTLNNGPYLYSAPGGGALTVAGRPGGATALTAPEGSDSVLTLNGGDHPVVVRDLHVTAPNKITGTVGLRVISSAAGTLLERVAVTRRQPVPPGSQVRGLVLDEAGTIRDSTIDLTPAAGAGVDTGLLAGGSMPSRATVDGLTVRAARAIETSEPLTVLHAAITTGYIGISATADTSVVDTSIFLAGAQRSASVGMLASGGSLTAANVTIAGGLASSSGVALVAPGGGSIVSSILAVAHPLELDAYNPSDSVSVAIQSSLIDLTKITNNGSGQFHLTDSGGIIAGDPRFRAPADGDLRLTQGSPAVDRGIGFAGVNGFPATDLAGVPRVVDGDGDGAAQMDMGAYELAPPAARAVASGTLAGTPATFDASASTSPVARPLTFVWRFDDGGAASGATVTHTFATPGTHTATVTVSDDDGLAATATATVALAAPTVIQTIAAAAIPPLPVGLTHLSLSPSKVKRGHSTHATFVLTVRSTVTATILHGKHTVRTTTKALGPGERSLTISGHGLAPGTYHVRIVARDAAGAVTKAITKTLKVTR